MPEIASKDSIKERRKKDDKIKGLHSCRLVVVYEKKKADLNKIAVNCKLEQRVCKNAPDT